MKKLWLSIFSMLAIGFLFIGCEEDSIIDPVIQPVLEDCVVANLTDEEGKLIANYTFNEEGKLRLYELPDGSCGRYTYYSNGMIYHQFRADGSELIETMSFDEAGNLDQVQGKGTPLRTFFYTVDGYLERIEYAFYHDPGLNYTRYFTVKDGNYVSETVEYAKGVNEFIAYEYYPELPNRDGGYNYLMEGEFHKGLNIYGRASKNLLKAMTFEKTNGYRGSYAFEYTLDENLYIETRTLSFHAGPYYEVHTQRFLYNCGQIK